MYRRQWHLQFVLSARVEPHLHDGMSVLQSGVPSSIISPPFECLGLFVLKFMTVWNDGFSRRCIGEQFFFQFRFYGRALWNVRYHGSIISVHLDSSFSLRPLSPSFYQGKACDLRLM